MRAYARNSIDMTTAVAEVADDINRDRPIFIVGGSRTGSEMLKTMLSASPKVDFVDELFLLSPRWLHKDLKTNIKEHVRDLGSPDAVDRLLDLFYSDIPYGWFWSVIDRELDRAALRRELSNGNLDLPSILGAIMKVHAKMRGKSGLGAKFPVHYSDTDKLLDWYPDCRLIHTTRNPKDVYASQAAKYISADQNRVSKHFSRFKQFVHINIQTTWTAHLHKALAGRQNYKLVRYEDVVANPEETTRDVCAFLDIPFTAQMLEPNQYGSSFGNKKDRRGIETGSVGRWRQRISGVSAVTMDVLHRSAYRILGYD